MVNTSQKKHMLFSVGNILYIRFYVETVTYLYSDAKHLPLYTQMDPADALKYIWYIQEWKAKF